MRRNYKLYLEDILASSVKILQYVGDASYEEFLRDEMRLEAIARNFEIIGEASSKVPQEIKDRYPAVGWRKISDFRNVVAHMYFGINYKIMWDIITNKLPGLITHIKEILEKEQ